MLYKDCTLLVKLIIVLRGGSRVVQVISRNHSNVSKPAFVLLRFFIVNQEINYPSCFIV